MMSLKCMNHRASRLSLFISALLLGAFFAAAQASAAPPRPDHIVIVIEENRAYDQIIGSPDAPYINSLARQGMLFTQSYAVTHPSQPNYIALFAGTTEGVDDDDCPITLTGPNLAAALQAKQLSFASYSEALPAAGSLDCRSAKYRRKHNPAANWQGLEATLLPFSAFPSDFTKLPTVALVVPDQDNDMHDGSVAQGDAWLKQNIDAYANWALTHNSLLILTWDEDNYRSGNHIVTIMLGKQVKPGTSAQRIDHYNVLRTIEEMYGLPYLGETAKAAPIRDVWVKQSGKK